MVLEDYKPELSNITWTRNLEAFHSPELNDDRTINAALKFVRDLVDLGNQPTVNNMFSVTAALGVLDVLEGLADIGAGIIGDIEAEERHREIIAHFHELHHTTTNIRQDIADLERRMRWGFIGVQYSAVRHAILEAMNLARHITVAPPGQQENAMERFREHCSSVNIRFMVFRLIYGVTGRDGFGENILSAFYSTSGGHRPDMIKLGGRLMHLVNGGYWCYMAYESMLRGRSSARWLARQDQVTLIQIMLFKHNLLNSRRDYWFNMHFLGTFFATFKKYSPGTR